MEPRQPRNLEVMRTPSEVTWLQVQDHGWRMRSDLTLRNVSMLQLQRLKAWSTPTKERINQLDPYHLEITFPNTIPMDFLRRKAVRPSLKRLPHLCKRNHSVTLMTKWELCQITIQVGKSYLSKYMYTKSTLNILTRNWGLRPLLLVTSFFLTTLRGIYDRWSEEKMQICLVKEMKYFCSLEAVKCFTDF